MNPFYQSFQKNQNGNPSSNLPKNPQELVAFLTSNHMTPEQKVRQMLQNKEMTPEQFNQLAAKADQLMGRKR